MIIIIIITINNYNYLQLLRILFHFISIRNAKITNETERDYINEIWERKTKTLCRGGGGNKNKPQINKANIWSIVLNDN